MSIRWEGCSRLTHTQGHGTLNAIYAAIDSACEARGWEGVDLLIIGGDFQVRAGHRYWLDFEADPYRQSEMRTT